MKMTEASSGGLKPSLDFNIIQHSQSNFEGVKGVLVKQTKPDPRSKAAIQSFANAGGGANHMLDPIEGEESTSDDEGMQTIEVEPNNYWTTDDNCKRWIVIDGLKKANPRQVVSADIDAQKFLSLLTTLN